MLGPRLSPQDQSQHVATRRGLEELDASLRSDLLRFPPSPRLRRTGVPRPYSTAVLDGRATISSVLLTFRFGRGGRQKMANEKNIDLAGFLSKKRGFEVVNNL